MTSREPVENKGSKRRNNCALECGPEWTSWICNNWTAGVTAVIRTLADILEICSAHIRSDVRVTPRYLTESTCCSCESSLMCSDGGATEFERLRSNHVTPFVSMEL